MQVPVNPGGLTGSGSPLIKGGGGSLGLRLDRKMSVPVAYKGRLLPPLLYKGRAGVEDYAAAPLTRSIRHRYLVE